MPKRIISIISLTIAAVLYRQLIPLLGIGRVPFSQHQLLPAQFAPTLFGMVIAIIILLVTGILTLVNHQRRAIAISIACIMALGITAWLLSWRYLHF